MPGAEKAGRSARPIPDQQIDSAARGCSSGGGISAAGFVAD
jgi:hypothetical protein